MTRYQLHRYISAYERHGDAHISDIEFVAVPSLEFLQALFNLPSDNPMYDVGAIDPHIAEKLRPFLPFALDLEKHAYFLECDQI